ncbi:helix-turn-helix domain-containing protein [Rhizobium sp. SG570]|uniref:TetR/AcrR family transcriptional regulator n=1 Tax=Rhizobium sp. SG570 TaxID=2587113 RepID=UPI0032B15AB9
MYIRITDPNIRTIDPFIKALDESRKKIYSHLLAVARDVVAEHGTDVSMRDIARRADFGLATLLRHFPTRERSSKCCCGPTWTLTHRAHELEASAPSAEALLTCFREWIAIAQSHRGVVALMAACPHGPRLRALCFMRGDARSARDCCSKLRPRGWRALT